MKKILVPTDYSDHAKEALIYAIKLAKHTGGRINILHAYQLIPASIGLAITIEEHLRSQAEKDMEQLIEDITPLSNGISIKTTIMKGIPAPAIATVAAYGNYDGIIMGTKGASGLKEIFIGSVAGDVIKESQIPVLVIPKDASFQPIKNIVFAIGDYELNDPEVVTPLKELAQLYKSKIKIFHIILDSEQEGKYVQTIKAIQGLDYSLNYVIDNQKTDDNITEFVAQTEPDLLCLIRQKKGLFDRLFGENITLKQTFHTKIPLLILENK